MVVLLDTFPRICLDDLDRDGAQRHVTSIHESQREVENVLRNYKMGTRLTGDNGILISRFHRISDLTRSSVPGKKLVHELKNILERIMSIAKIMENFQRKLLLLACKKASDVITVLKNSHHNNQWNDKEKLYNMHMDNLLNLAGTRMDILEQQKYVIEFSISHQQKKNMTCCTLVILSSSTNR
jgi:hypothetical protein